MRIILKMLGVVLVAPLLLAAGCTDDEGSGGEGLLVASSVFPLSEAARAVGGDRVRVVDLTPAGAEPHDVELTPRQVDRARSADVLLYLGEGFQPAVEDLADQVEGETIDVLEGLTVVDGDPHVWLDPTLMRRIVEKVRAAFTAADEEGEDGYAERADRFLDRLAAVDRAYRDGLAECDRNVVVTSHASFEYVTSRYGLEQEAIAESPEAEPDPARLSELSQLVREAGVTTIFTEPLVEDGPAEALARETGVRTAVLDPLESGQADPGGGGYFTVMESNLAALRSAMGCA